MPPGPQTDLQAISRRLQALRRGLLAGLALAFVAPFPALAQDSALEPAASAPTPQGELAETPREVAFEANTVSYDSDGDTVTAEGDVLLRSGDQSVRADAVSWNRTSGQIVATGNVLHVADPGDTASADEVRLPAASWTSRLLAAPVAWFAHG